MKAVVKRYRENAEFRLFIWLLTALLASRAVMLLLVFVYHAITGDAGQAGGYTVLMNPWDARRYQFIIDNGYTFPLDTDPQANWAFFPMYVIVCVVLKTITFGLFDTYHIGMFVSNVCILIAAYYAVRYIDGIYGSKTEDVNKYAKTVLLGVLLFIAPYTFYCASAYTEAMFMMFIVLFFYACQNKRFLLAGLWSALASGTRIVGCTLVFALLMEIYFDRFGCKVSIKNIKEYIIMMLKTPKYILGVMLCPLGTFAYMFFLRFFNGDVWAFLHVQIAWRDEKYFPVIGVLWKACTGQMEPRYTYMGWVCIAALVVYGYMFVKKHYSMAVFGFIALFIALSSHVMSTCRFIAGSFVIFVGIYDLITSVEQKKKWLKWLIIGLSVVVEIILVLLWYNYSDWIF